MQIIIEIPKYIYDMTIDQNEVIYADNEAVTEAIKKGAILPKGHGRLISADSLKRKMQKISTEAWKMKIKAPVETVWNQVIDLIEGAPTVIAAEKDEDGRQ